MKKITRILIVLSLLAILASVITVTAFAEETSRITIDRVDIYAPEPQLGQDPHEFEKLITCAEQNFYTITISGVGTSTGNWGTGFSTTAAFYFYVHVKAETGYTFNNTKVYLNNVDTGKTISGQNSIYSYCVIIGEMLTQIDLPGWPEGIKAGDDVSACQPELPEDAKFYVNATWCNTAYEPVSKLESGKVYYLKYVITPKEGYHFRTARDHDKDIVVTVGGAAVTCSPQIREITIMHSYGIDVQPISSVNINYIRPRVGDLRSDFNITVTEGITIRNKNIKTLATTPTQNLTFEEGIPYTLSVTIRPSQGYVFAENLTVTFNGGSPQQFQLPTNALNVDTLQHEIEFALPVDTVALPAFPETVTPGPGGIADMTAPEGASYTLKQAWIDMRTGQIVETLESGDLYTLAYMAEPKPGYVFDENTKATLGGQECVFASQEEYVVVYRSYDLGAQKLDRVDLTLPQLYKGCTPGAVTVAQDANYTLLGLIWAEGTTESFDDCLPVATVNYNTHIFAVPVLCAGKGYTFAEDVKLFFNGEEVPVLQCQTEGPLMELAGYVGILTPPTTDGWCQEDNTWVYYKDGQKLVSQWYRDSKDWVYLGTDGKMLKNAWQRDSIGWCYLGDQGYMLRSSWLNDGGKWYYLNSGGYMLSSTWQKDSKDWVYLGKDGAMVTNTWQRDSKGWCYLGGNGYMVRNMWVSDSKGVCRVGADGYMKTSAWVHDGNGWAYVDAKGYAVIGDWVFYKNDWYAMGSDGYMIANSWVSYKGDTYRLGADGKMLTSQWVAVGSEWSYVDANGKIPYNSFVKDKSGTYYIGKDGIMLKNITFLHNDKRYGVDENGKLLRNTTKTFYSGSGYIQNIPTTYRFDSNGVATMVNPW